MHVHAMWLSMPSSMPSLYAAMTRRPRKGHIKLILDNALKQFVKLEEGDAERCKEKELASFRDLMKTGGMLLEKREIEGHSAH